MLINSQKELVLKGYDKLSANYAGICEILDNEVLKHFLSWHLVALLVPRF